MRSCPQCGQELTDEMTGCPACTAKRVKAGTIDEDSWVYLKTVPNDLDFKMTASLLKLAEIPALKKVKGLDGFVEIIMGVPIAGVDILVPKDRYTEAVDLLNAEFEEPGE